MKKLPNPVRNEILEISFTQRKTYSQVKSKNNKQVNFYLALFIVTAFTIASILTHYGLIKLF